ncbi:interaptin-like isoform X2 [Sipha flava]|uniref:Interaptin-like isoform X2 n=1 Tax=Sipha flava TaxID=143950 RepID=A0A8B8GT17_9HEMI|nr:interaptin-like isoform X2 [Sipha flava]
MTTNVSPNRSNIISSSHPSKGSLTDRPSSCSNKSLEHNKSCPVHSRPLSYKTIGQCHDKIEELEKQNIRLVSKIKVLKYQLKTSSNLYNNIHQRPEKPLSRHSQRSTPIKLQKMSRLSRVGFDENEKIITLPERKFESTESFDSESSLVENKSKFKENIELIQSHRVIKSMEIQMETLQAQCKAFEQNLIDVNKLFKKKQDEYDKLKEKLNNEEHNLSELKLKYNAFKESNKALEEQIRDLQKEKLSLKEHNQKLLQITSKPQHQISGLKLKELEENFSDSRAGLLKQMEENSKYIAELKGTINENEIKLSNYIDENKCLKNQHSELSKLLELKDNEISNKYKEINQILQENSELKEKIKIIIKTPQVNDSEDVTVHQNLESEDKRLKSQIQELQQEQVKINQTLNSQSYLNTMLKDKLDQAERDLKAASQLTKIFMNLFTDITRLDISEPLIATLEIIEKAVCSIKKNIEINGENKEFEEIVNNTLEILVLFRDQMVKRQTIFNQVQSPKKPIVNLITDSMTKSENTPRIQEDSAQLEININTVSFSTESIQHLKSLQSEPNIFLTWGFKDQEDIAYSPSRLAWAADFNCSCYYRSNSSTELLHFVAKHGLFINVHLVTEKLSPIIASGLVNTMDSINNPMIKFNLIVPITGKNIDAKLKCSIQLICDYHEIQTYSQMVDDEYSNIGVPINKPLIQAAPNNSY